MQISRRVNSRMKSRNDILGGRRGAELSHRDRGVVRAGVPLEGYSPELSIIHLDAKLVPLVGVHVVPFHGAGGKRALGELPMHPPRPTWVLCKDKAEPSLGGVLYKKR